jgi:hypothetical protein
MYKTEKSILFLANLQITQPGQSQEYFAVNQLIINLIKYPVLTFTIQTILKLNNNIEMSI